MATFYNEIEPFAAQWLENLIAAGHITPGKVERKSIHDLRADELTTYTRCHFFAGICGWDLALALAGWPADRPVWTGSCPCQPFSAAGKRKGNLDARHLWPDFYALIRAAMPPTIFGEQVASADGRIWLNGVRADLEAVGYEVGAADLCAAGVGAPHIRQRLFWVAYAEDKDRWTGERCKEKRVGANQERWGRFASGGAITRPEHTKSIGWEQWRTQSSWWGSEFRRGADGKSRRIEPGIESLAHGVSGRVGKLRAYGNAICPPLAAEFISAFMEATGVTK